MPFADSKPPIGATTQQPGQGFLVPCRLPISMDGYNLVTMIFVLHENFMLT